MPAAKLKSHQLPEAIRLYEGGLSLAEVGAVYGLSRQAMFERLKGNVTLRPQLRFGADNHFYRGETTASARAHDITEKALLKGLLVRQACEVCGANGTFKDGRSEVQAHHDDYGKPLDVRWLCQKHHHEWHKNHKAAGA